MPSVSYQVVKSTSHDVGYSAAELDGHGSTTSTTKGWVSARFCEYPQKLLLKFWGVSDLKKIQILSHQSKIATSIEVFVGNREGDGVAWERLGYLSLDDNSRSSYKARELKSVYVNARAEFLRLVIKKCHINTITLFNQVGIVAINLCG